MTQRLEFFSRSWEINFSNSENREQVTVIPAAQRLLSIVYHQAYNGLRISADASAKWSWPSSVKAVAAEIKMPYGLGTLDTRRSGYNIVGTRGVVKWKWPAKFGNGRSH